MKGTKDTKDINKNGNELKKAEDKLGKKLDKLVNTRTDNYNNYEEIRETFGNLQEKIEEVEKTGFLKPSQTKLIIEGREFRLIKDEAELDGNKGYCGELGLVIEKRKAGEDHYREIGEYGKERKLLTEKKGDYYFSGASCGYEENPERSLEYYAKRQVERLEGKIKKLEEMDDKAGEIHKSNEGIDKKKTKEKEIQGYKERLERAKEGGKKMKELKDKRMEEAKQHNEKELGQV